jgi:hypothetical protein
MTRNSFDLQLADSLAMPDSEVMPGADVLTLVHARRPQSAIGPTPFAGAQLAGGEDRALRDRSAGSTGALSGALDPRPQTAPSQRERGRLLSSVGVGVAVAVLVAAAVGGSMLVSRRSGSPTVPTSAAHHATPIPSTALALTWPVTLPTGQSPLGPLAPDPTREGVWFTSYSSSEAYAYFYSPATKQLTTFPVGSTNQAVNLTYFSQEGLAVDSAGNVWIGANNQLVELAPSSGDVTHWTIPTPAASAVADEFAKSHIVTSLVIGPNGEVVIAETGAATLTTFNASTDTFGVLAIPQAGEVQALAASSDGTIAVAMSDRQSDGSFVNNLVVLVHPDGTQTDVAAPSSWIGSAGSEFVMGDRGQVSAVASSSKVGTAMVAADLVNGRNSNFDLNVAAVLPDGSVAIATTTAIDIVANGAVQQTIPLPRWACAGTWNPPPGDTQTPPATCQETPTHIVVDRSGNIWVSPDQPQNELGVIPTS